MNAHVAFPRGPCPRRCGWALALLLCFCLPDARADIPSPPAAPAPAAPAALAGWSWSYIENAVGNRRRMIQVLVVLMILGLYIIWWRK
ncbi:MAG: hypothetical protein L0212_11360 [Acidobacteria bacterium]|nr:hypothetical protein [Acidobacteriota bacterium]